MPLVGLIVAPLGRLSELKVIGSPSGTVAATVKLRLSPSCSVREGSVPIVGATVAPVTVIVKLWKVVVIPSVAYTRTLLYSPADVYDVVHVMVSVLALKIAPGGRLSAYKHQRLARFGSGRDRHRNRSVLRRR